MIGRRGGRARFPGRRAARRRHGERAREPVLQPDADERRRARERVRRPRLGHPAQDGSARAAQRAGPRRIAARPAGAAAAQPPAAAAAAGRGPGWGGGKGGPVVSRSVATCRCPPQGPDMALSRLRKAIEECCPHLAGSVHIRCGVRAGGAGTEPPRPPCESSALSVSALSAAKCPQAWECQVLKAYIWAKTLLRQISCLS